MQMTDAALLTKIKDGLGITGAYQDATLTVYVDDVKAFMKSAGVSDAVISSDAAVGCIMRGVADLWNYGSGNATLSEYFRMRVIQLKMAKVKNRNRIDKIAPYLYRTDYAELDYEIGAAYFEKFRPSFGLCSAVSKGELFGRNYDWKYDARCSFVVKTSAVNGRHATVGMASAPSDITEQFITSGEYSESYDVIPFLLTDGINDAGLICEINVVPAGDKGFTTGTNPFGEDLCAIMIPRYLLDYASDVGEAIALLEQRNIFAADSDELQQEFHFMLSDGSRTAVIEFVDNEMTVIEDFVDDKPIMTNFYLDGYNGTKASLTPYSQGIERHAILLDGYGNVNTEKDMIELMKSVIFTKTYTELENPWYSEFNGKHGEPYGDLTKDSTPEEYEPIVAAARAAYAERERDGATWQTVHASVYNRDKRKLIVIPQESGRQYSFYMNGV